VFARHPSLSRLLWLCGVSLGMCGRAYAQDASQPDASGVELRYDAPEGCGSRELVLQQVRRASGRVLGEGPPLRVSAQVRAAETGFRVRYEARRRGAASKRELLVADCAAAVEAVALLILLTLEPVAHGESTPAVPDEQGGDAADEGPARVSRSDADRGDVSPSNAAEPNPTGSSPNDVESEAPPNTAPGNPLTSEPPQVVRRRGNTPERAPELPTTQEDSVSTGSSSLALSPLRVGVGYELATALAPTTGQGVRLSLGTGLGGVRGELSGASLWVSDTSVPGVSDATLSSHLYRVRVRLGYPLDWGGVWLAPTAGVGLEHLWARVDGISRPASNATTWLTASLGLDVEVELSRALAVRAGAAAFLVTQRPKFTVINLEVVHQPQPWGLEGAFGVVWTWPSQ
jgi:hypothetical protein